MSIWRKLFGKAGIAKPGNTQPESTPSTGHVEDVRAVGASADGSIIACVPLKGHVGLVRAVSASADGSIIATGSYDATVRLWNPTTGQEVGRLNVDSDIGTLAMSPDGTQVVIGCKSNFVEVWEVRSGKRLVQMKGHGDFPCSSMDCSRDGRWAASASWNEPGVFLWDLKAGRLERQIIPEGASSPRAVSVAFAPDSTKLAIGDADGVFICEVPSGKLVAELEGLDARCHSVKYLDDDTVASVSANGDVKIQSVSKQALLRHHRLERWGVYAGAVSDDGKRAAIGLLEGTVREWDLETGSAVMERPQAHGANQIMAVMYVPGTHTWLSCDASGAVNLWNPSSPAPVAAAPTVKTRADRIRELEEVLTQRPNWADGHDQLAREYWDQGDVVNMFRHFYAAARADPGSNQPHKYLKEIYAALGRPDAYAQEDTADKRTDPHASVGGTMLTSDLRYKLQNAAIEHREELEAAVRQFGA